MNRPLEELLNEHELGSLDEAGYTRLREMLKQDPQAREQFLQWQVVSIALADESTFADDASPTGNVQGAVENKISLAEGKKRLGEDSNRWLTFAAALTLLAVLFFAITQWWPRFDQTKQLANQTSAGKTDKVEPTSEGLAILTRLVDVEWDDDSVICEAGDALKPGVFAIKTGLAQIEFFSGATVVVEGPAKLELKSASLAKVHGGRLRANVPEVARGFSLEVDGAKVVDLGTEFGLAVDESGMDVQVFEGLVEIHSSEKGNDQPADKTTIRAGAGVSRSSNGEIRPLENKPDEFVTLSQLESRQSERVKEKASQWTRWSNSIRKDQEVIAYYAFDRSGSWFRKLECDSRNSKSEQVGAIIGARRVNGRWMSKGGLEFKRPGDRVRMNLPGEFGSLSFAAWVRIDSLDRMYNSLFLTDNYNQGEPHWQILDTGQIFFSVRWRSDDWERGKSPNGKAHYPVISPKFWKPSLSGKWIHLATTFDIENGEVTHYFNGEPIHAEKIPQELMVSVTRIGEATMGNWSIPTQPDEKFAIRNLNGTIDEMLIMKTALSADRIKKIYRIGKP